MTTAFTHAACAVTLGRTVLHRPVPRRFWILAIILSILPDADVIGFRFGVAYGDFLGHRGLFHSIPFAALAGTVCAMLFFRTLSRRRRALLAVALSIVTASHSLLDALTDGGLGIAFFSPFDQTRYFLPWRPVHVSPIGIRAFFSEWGLRVVLSELIWIWIPCGILLFAPSLWRCRRRGSGKDDGPPSSEPRD